LPWLILLAAASLLLLEAHSPPHLVLFHQQQAWSYDTKHDTRQILLVLFAFTPGVESLSQRLCFVLTQIPVVEQLLINDAAAMKV